MRKVFIIGIGAGNPDYVTLQAIDALNRVDVFFVIDKGPGKDDLVRLRRDICARYIKDRSYRTVEIADPAREPDAPCYEESVKVWHAQRLTVYENAIAHELGDGQCGAFLVWGDPCLYDSTLRIIDQIVARGAVTLEYEVVPGITSVQALAARHKIALNRIGGPVEITTGRRLAEGLPHGVDDVVVMLDGACAFKSVAESGVDIYWGAYLGTPDEILISGPLADVADKIEVARARARADKGWIMDTYLLRRAGGSGR
jgi:precorrin-6A synthase